MNSNSTKRVGRGQEKVKNPDNLNCLRDRVFSLTDELTCSQLEKQTMVSDSSIKAISNGIRSNPKIDNLISIAKGLSVSIDYLVGLKNEKEVHPSQKELSISAISEFLGLSEDSVRILHMYNQPNDYGISKMDFYKVLDEIIESTSFVSFILHMADYLRYCNSYFHDDTESIEVKEYVFTQDDLDRKIYEDLRLCLDKIKSSSSFQIKSKESDLRRLRRKKEEYEEILKKEDVESVKNKDLRIRNWSAYDAERKLNEINKSIEKTEMDIKIARAERKDFKANLLWFENEYLFEEGMEENEED